MRVEKVVFEPVAHLEHHTPTDAHWSRSGNTHTLRTTTNHVQLEPTTTVRDRIVFLALFVGVLPPLWEKKEVESYDPLIELGIYHPRKKTRKKTLRFHCFFFDFVLETDTLLSIDRWHEYRSIPRLGPNCDNLHEILMMSRSGQTIILHTVC